MNGKLLGAFLLAASSATATVASADTFTVAGTSNPFLTGYPSGGSVTINGYTDTAPAESPVDAGSVFGGERIVFSNVTGSVSNGPCCSPDGPNGGSPTSSAGGTTVGGYDDFPINSLIGVFYDASAAQGAVNSSTSTLVPAVNQVFFIGDGSLGTFVVPTGATLLYLGTVDGYQWNNNSGSFTVTVGSVPEASTWAMMMLGFAGLAFAGYWRARIAVTPV